MGTTYKTGNEAQSEFPGLMQVDRQGPVQTQEALSFEELEYSHMPMACWQ